jgi:hypothetical protein
VGKVAWAAVGEVERAAGKVERVAGGVGKAVVGRVGKATFLPKGRLSWQIFSSPPKRWLS